MLLNVTVRLISSTRNAAGFSCEIVFPKRPMFMIIIRRNRGNNRGETDGSIKSCKVVEKVCSGNVALSEDTRYNARVRTS